MHQALADFGASLNRIRALANNILGATGPALADPLVRDRHETQQCGSVVLLTGYFEAFLKDLVKRYIEELSACGIAFANLPKKVQEQHLIGGGKVLTKAAECVRKGKPAPFGDATPQDIIARLHSAYSGKSYQIVWEAFANTQSNPGPDVVKEIAESLELKNFWPTVSSHSGDRLRWSDSAMISKLRDLIEKRNACAHTGTVSPIPTAGDILDFADMLEAIGTGFVTALENVLAAQHASIAASTTSHTTIAASPVASL